MALALGWLSPGRARAEVQWTFEGVAQARGVWLQNHVVPFADLSAADGRARYLRAEHDDLLPGAILAAGVDGDLGGGTYVRGMLDTGLLAPRSPFDPASGPVSSGRPIDGGGEQYVRALYVGFAPWTGARVRAGKRPARIGEGLIYDGDAPGLDLLVDFLPRVPLELGATAVLPGFALRAHDIDSPLVALHVDWLTSPFDAIGVFVAGMLDRGAIASVFEGMVDEAAVVSPSPANDRLLFTDVETRGRLTWIGLRGAGDLGARARWLGVAVLGRGHVDLGLAGGGVSRSIDVRGRALDAGLLYDVGAGFSAGPFLLYLSGDRSLVDSLRGGTPEETRRWNAVVTPHPFIDRANLFFGSGLDAGVAGRGPSPLGVNGRGVIAPGIEASFAPEGPWAVEARALYLAADAEGPFGGRSYGIEADIEASRELAHGVAAFAELDVLVPGSFFRGGAPMLQAIAGAEARWP